MAELDLGLLKILKVLLEVNNTRKAGEILGMSQPTISKALNKLRQHFDDPLFIRQAHGLQPTSKAIKLAGKVPGLVAQLDQLLEVDKEFDPTKIDHKVTIAMNSFLFPWLGQAIAKRIIANAPDIELHIIHWNQDSEKEMLRGEIDLGLNYTALNLSKLIDQKKIGEDTFVYVVRKDHPLVGTKIDVSIFDDYAIATAIIPNWTVQEGEVEKIVAQINENIQTRFRSTSLSLTLSMIQDSDLIFPCSQSLATTFDPNLFEVLPIPEVISAFDGSILLSNERVRNDDKLIKWVTEQVQQSIAEFN